MIQLLAGLKGEGKTKRLIAMANEKAEKADGKVVFIDDDRRHIHDISHIIRFIDTTEFPLANFREFAAFIHGVLSMDNDVSDVYIDGLTNLIPNLDSDNLIDIKNLFSSLGKDRGVNFTATINIEPGALPSELAYTLVINEE
ncbi:MAG: hypothetical protein FWC95_02875 [Defluviitaleaceae bacterium]|nr:hypothetical protein [Defluviitaleaceae bacterium]